METIDLMTAMILGLSINVIMAVIILITASKFPTMAAQSMKYWAIGLFFLALSYFIYSGFYQNTSWVFDFLGDFSVVIGITFMSFAVSVFLKIQKIKTYQLIVLLTMVALFFSGIIFHSSTSSIAITILAISLSTVVAAKPLLAAIIRQPTSAKIILFSISALILVVLVYRGIDYFLDPRIAFDLKQLYTADLLTILIAVVGPVTATFGFLLMHQD